MVTNVLHQREAHFKLVAIDNLLRLDSCFPQIFAVHENLFLIGNLDESVVFLLEERLQNSREPLFADPSDYSGVLLEQVAG
jgi:hypothetical protein